MKPAGGVTFFVHIIINAFFRLMKYPRKALPFLIIFAVTALIVTIGRISVVNSLEEDNNFQLLSETLNACKPVKQAYSENKVVLRIDDIQASAYQSMVEAMVKDAKIYNMRLVLGIIPRNFLQDKKLVRFIKRNDCNLEAALHGWGHFSDEENSLFEFEEMGVEEARSKIQDGKKILEDTFGNPVVTFIPPGNEISDETKEVLDEEGIRYISSGYVGGEFDMTAGTYDFPSKSLVGNGEILKRCEVKFERKEPCIIVMHPQDYLTDGQPDPEKYKFYIGLLDELRRRNVYSVTFSDLELRQKQSTETATLFQTPAHPYLLGSKERTCFGPVFARTQFY
jgi:peptidoglycan/xylan/chitin deacetylase (PgdA/CDA1 family)